MAQVAFITSADPFQTASKISAFISLYVFVQDVSLPENDL